MDKTSFAGGSTPPSSTEPPSAQTVEMSGFFVFMGKLTQQDYEAAAQQLGCTVAAIRAVVAVESAGAGFAPDGRAILRFEVHKFWEYWGRKNSAQFSARFKYNQSKKWLGHQVNTDGKPLSWINPHANQHNEWIAFEFAKSLDEEAAMLSISLGLFQIVGFNFRACGNATVAEWFWDHCESEARQLERFCTFIKTQKLDDELRRLDWFSFASRYNGPGKAADYASKLQAAHSRYK